jgi:peptidyl-prolyl cis-trans isomerase D
MAIIQTIRDKGAAIVIGVIALSLIGFLLMDARSGSAKLFGSNNSTEVGKVNGDAIEIDEFNEKEKALEQQYGNQGGSSMRYQIRQSVWDNLVAERLLNSEFNKAGLNFTPKELAAIMFSDDAPSQLKQLQFLQNEQTHQYDIEKAKQWWAEVKKTKNEEQKNAVNSQIIDPLKLNTLYGKYMAMIQGSVYMPSWMENIQNQENSVFSNISYIAIPYSEISDSAVTVTDGDINSYVQSHKAKYKQDGGRMISYVTFSIAPSPQDSSKAKEDLEKLSSAFAIDTSAKIFVTRNGSSTPYSDAFVQKDKLPAPIKDTMAKLANNTVFGPYLDGSKYVLAKKLDTKIMPDSIKCRHILLGVTDRQGQPIMPDSVAHAKADSVETAIKNGANFDSLEAKYSTDQVAHKDKGVMTFDLATIQGGLAKDFADFLMNEKGETKKVVKTEFGYHYIEILEKKNPQPTYKVAYISRDIDASDETRNVANAAAIKLIGQAKTEKDFDKYIAANGINKVSLPNVVKENDYSLGMLQDARDIVRWAFKAEEGEVTQEPYFVGNNVVVAVVSRIVKEGVPDAKTARPMVESLIRNMKKAEEIKKKLGNPATLEAAAVPYKKGILTTGADSTLTFKANIINGIGSEPKVAGAAFNADYKEKVSPPIAGNTGVFVIKINSIADKALESEDTKKQRLASKLGQMAQSAMGQSYQALKKQADIVDKRSRFF